MFSINYSSDEESDYDSDFSEIIIPELKPVRTNEELILTACNDVSVVKYSIPHFVTNIGVFAFRDCYRLREVEFPNTVKTIQPMAFEGLVLLRKFNLPPKLETIHICAFQGCNNIINLIIPDSVISIGENAFNYCSRLRSVKLPNFGIVGNNVFGGCASSMTFEIRDMQNIRTYAELETVLTRIGITSTQHVEINHSLDETKTNRISVYHA